MQAVMNPTDVAMQSSSASMPSDTPVSFKPVLMTKQMPSRLVDAEMMWDSRLSEMACLS